MRNRILAAYPDSEFEERKSEVFYIADFTKRTANFDKSLKRGVEFLDSQPSDPNEPQKPMPCLIVQNPNHVSVDCNVFDDNQFLDDKGNQLKHGECCFFPTKNDGRSWFTVAEIKDCIPGKVSDYKRNIQETMDSVYEIFRNIVSIPNKFYFIVSFPRKKTALNQALFSDYVDMKKYRRAFLVVTNSAIIIDTHEIIFQL